MTSHDEDVLNSQGRKPLRAAAAECADCHYVFEKPFMHAHFDQATPGRYSPGRTTTFRDKSGIVRGTSQSEGRFTSGTTKKVWVCDNCNSQRVRRTNTNWLVGLSAVAAVTAFLFALPDRPRTDATNSPPAVTTASESPLNESETAGNLESTDLPKVMEEPPADSDAERVPSTPSDAPSEPLQSELEVDGKTAQNFAETDEDALVAATLAQKVADKLARSERRMDFDWSTRANGVKFRIAASEKTISDVSQCRNLRFQVVDGTINDFEPDQLWCKSGSNEGWAKQVTAIR